MPALAAAMTAWSYHTEHSSSPGQQHTCETCQLQEKCPIAAISLSLFLSTTLTNLFPRK